MDWRHVNFDWNRARAFLVTAEEGSLSAAARALHMTQPTLGRQVAALESELGVILFERAGRGLVLTPSGLELLDHVRAMGTAAGNVALAASGQQKTIEGTVRVSASEMYAAYSLPPVVAKLRSEQPGIDIEIIATNTLSDLRRREADIAVRSVRPTDPNLVAKHVATDSAQLYATRKYLKSIGNPTTIEAFTDAQFIGFDDNGPILKALTDRGFDLTSANFAIRTESHLVNWHLACAGLGIGIAPITVGGMDRRMVRAIEWVDEMEFPVWLVSHRDVKTSARVRLVFDMLAEAFSSKNPKN